MSCYRKPARVLALPGILVVTAFFVGCNSNQPSGNQSDGKAKPKIALIMKSLANEFFSTMANGAKAHHDSHSDDYKLIVNGIKDERDLGRQVGLVDEMVAAGVDAIVIAPADSKALVPVLKKAQQAGVVVVNIDNKLDAGVLADAEISIPFVGPDNRDGARLAGEHLARQLKSGDRVAILEGVPTAFNGQQRKLGFEDAMKSAGIKIIDSQSAQWEMGIANQVAAAMLVEHPDIKALLCANDNMALGALAAVKAAGRAKETAIVGFDNISAVQDAIRSGSILATVDQHGDQLAVYGIEFALEAIQSGTGANDTQMPADKQTPVDLVTADTLKSP